MTALQVYVAVAIVILLIVFFIKKDRQAKRLSRLSSIAFAFILAGLLFNDNRLIGYGLIGTGVILAIVDIFAKRRK